MTISAPKATASLRAFRKRSRLPAMSPTIAGIWASAMTRRLAEEGMEETFARGRREAQCGRISAALRSSRRRGKGPGTIYVIASFFNAEERQKGETRNVTGFGA